MWKRHKQLGLINYCKPPKSHKFEIHSVISQIIPLLVDVESISSFTLPPKEIDYSIMPLCHSHVPLPEEYTVVCISVLCK